MTSNVLTQTDGEGNTTTYHRDLWGKVVQVTDANNVNNYYAYDYAGNITSTADGNGNTTSYEYNSMNLLSEMTDPMNQKVQYFYDLQGRLKTVNDGQSQVAQYSYNPDSTISQILYNTGANIVYQYDRDKNITSMTNRNQQGDIISSFAYTYDNNGNQKSKIENGETTYYTYDNLNRLSSVQYPTVGTENYTYDNAGNRLSKTNYKAAGGVPTVNISAAYTYDSLNRMTENLTDDILLAYKGITTYEYDNNGSLLSETTTQLDHATGQMLTTDPETGLPIQPQIKSYSYNAFNQNISVTNADGSYQQNIYDALGIRISTIENGYRSDYVFDRESIIAEFDGSGTLTNRNIRGYGLLAQKDDKGRLNYYLHNAHGDVTSLIDASGKVLNSYQYDAFGNTMTYSATVANRFLYAGEQLDTITGQYYLRARYYDPTVGRFTQEDTYRGDGLNLYVYVGNNPVNFIDPRGLCKDEIIAAVDEHILYNPNISEAAKKQLRKIIGKGTGNKGFGDFRVDQERHNSETTKETDTFVNYPNIAGNTLTGTMPSSSLAKAAEQAIVSGLAGLAKKILPVFIVFDIWWNNPIECDDGTRYTDDNNAADNEEDVDSKEKLPNQGTVQGNVEGAPSIDAGKQGKHVPGHNNNDSSKSQWQQGETGVDETQEAWQKGKTLPDGSKVWDTGKVVGQNGEIGVRVHIDGKGNIHGYPVNPRQYFK